MSSKEVKNKIIILKAIKMALSNILLEDDINLEKELLNNDSLNELSNDNLEKIYVKLFKK